MARTCSTVNGPGWAITAVLMRSVAARRIAVVPPKQYLRCAAFRDEGRVLRVVTLTQPRRSCHSSSSPSAEQRTTPELSSIHVLVRGGKPTEASLASTICGRCRMNPIIRGIPLLKISLSQSIVVGLWSAFSGISFIEPTAARGRPSQ